VQVRLQLGATGGPFGVAGGIIKNEGFGALYTVSAKRRDPLQLAFALSHTLLPKRKKRAVVNIYRPP
jgi:hypothetical protein